MGEWSHAGGGGGGGQAEACLQGGVEGVFKGLRLDASANLSFHGGAP